MTRIRYSRLRDLGFKGIVFDKDNTLTAPYKMQLFNSEVQDAISTCQGVFGKSNVLIFSNTAGSIEDIGHKLAVEIEANLAIRVFRHAQQKPEGGDELVATFKALGISSQEIAVVGDRYTTDILFGNLFGMFTIKTEILTPEGENAVVKSVRKFPTAVAMCSYVYAQIRALEERRIPKWRLRPPAHPLIKTDEVLHSLLR